MSKIDRIMTIGLVIFWLVVLVLILFCVLIREYLYFKNYISELEKRNQKLETELEAREKRLRDMRASDDDRFNYFNAVFAAMKDGIVVFKDDGALVLANRAARAFLHIDKHIFFKSDKSSYGAFYGLVSDVCREAFESATERRVEFQEGDRIFEVSALLIPDRYQKGICLGVMAVVIDVTEARRLEARRKEFVSNVSHEFRTPMTLISGYAEMLRMWDEVTKEERTKALDVIEQETKRLKKLVSELLTLSRLDRQEGQERNLPFVDVEAVIEQILWSLEDMANKRRVELVSDVEVDYPILRANEQFFYQMLLNLIENGIKYNREQGLVKVWARSDGNVLRITVSDSGMGIEEKHQERIFDRFYRIDEDRNSRHGGNGIGLSIVSSVVEQMRGRIQVESRPGEGSEFKIELPLNGGTLGG
ncbi:ATP-binding protein [Enterocloster lavalensis]|uniref:ATP-binding protein n=1 Tax=Enterocloster lavalensis TaxID=460384 RepID=UPI002A80B856|nr:ATP-binding protein [Enterocloster lavalensis]